MGETITGDKQSKYLLTVAEVCMNLNVKYGESKLRFDALMSNGTGFWVFSSLTSNMMCHF